MNFFERALHRRPKLTFVATLVSYFAVTLPMAAVYEFVPKHASELTTAIFWIYGIWMLFSAWHLFQYARKFKKDCE